MSKQANLLTAQLAELEKRVFDTFESLQVNGKVWADGVDNAIQLEDQNISLFGFIFKVEGNTLTTKQINGGEESQYSLNRCNLTDLIELLSAMEEYGQPAAKDAAIDAITTNPSINQTGF